MAALRVTETKQKIIDAAQELFFSKGYQDTSVNDIIEKTSLSKGAFYHHFKSKDDLLDSLTEALAERALSDWQKIVDLNMDAVSKLNKIFSFSRQFKAANKVLVRVYIDALYKPSNLKLFEQLRNRSLEKITPVLVEIVKQGRKEGLFDIEDPEESVIIAWDIIFGMARINAEYILKEKVADSDTSALMRRNTAYARALERVLGLRSGSIDKLVDKEFIDLFRELQDPKEEIE